MAKKQTAATPETSTTFISALDYGNYSRTLQSVGNFSIYLKEVGETYREIIAVNWAGEGDDVLLYTRNLDEIQVAPDEQLIVVQGERAFKFPILWNISRRGNGDLRVRGELSPINIGVDFRRLIEFSVDIDRVYGGPVQVVSSINWSAIGSVGAEDAIVFAEGIQYASMLVKALTNDMDPWVALSEDRRAQEEAEREIKYAARKETLETREELYRDVNILIAAGKLKTRFDMTVQQHDLVTRMMVEYVLHGNPTPKKELEAAYKIRTIESISKEKWAIIIPTGEKADGFILNPKFIEEFSLRTQARPR